MSTPRCKRGFHKRTRSGRKEDAEKFCNCKNFGGRKGEKEVSGLFVRGECASRRRRWRRKGENARSAPPANFLGEGRGGEGGGRRHRDRGRRDCDLLKFAVCCDNNDLEGRTDDRRTDGRRKSFQWVHGARSLALGRFGKRRPKRNEDRQIDGLRPA